MFVFGFKVLVFRALGLGFRLISFGVRCIGFKAKG